MYHVYLGLGSNLGDRQENLYRALEEIALLGTITQISSVYETEPVGIVICSEFLNMAVEIATTADPPLLMAQIKKIERKLGRRKESHGEPRTIDIDILLYRGFAYQDPTVHVPHPELQNRRFALEPLAEIAPTAVHPQIEKTVASLLRNCRDNHRVLKSEIMLHGIKTI
jgi:2-amino-4-hydroxy-6-hydroxymethyldihydropteridine diphosphokinase